MYKAVLKVVLKHKFRRGVASEIICSGRKVLEVVAGTCYKLLSLED